MRLLLVLVLFRPALCAVMGNKPICPGHTSVSILNPSAERNDPVCDLCEYLKSKDENYPMCSRLRVLHSPMMLDKLVADCKRITKSGRKSQLQWFSDVLGVFSSPDAKREDKYEGPICECDPCSELVKANKPFMKTCAPKMTRDMLSERFRTCKQVKQDQEQLWLFYQDLKEECFALTGENITLSICECDVCWLLFYETSDFMTKCGKYMDQATANKLFSSCEKIMCDPVELVFFKKDLELICEKKLNVTFEFPQCVCEECWLLFQKDSDFMQKCGFGMSDDMLKNLVEDCYTNLDNLDDFMTFIDDLQVTCQNEGKQQFKHEWCYCIDCLLFDDQESEIWKDCISHMPESLRITKRKECLNATLEETLDQYKENLFEFCRVNYGYNVTFPKCGSCLRTDLAIVFANDYSPSFRSHGYLSTEEIVWQRLIRGRIGENKTRFGLIRFDRTWHPMFNLIPGYFNYWSNYFFQKSHQHFRFLPETELTHTLELIGRMFDVAATVKAFVNRTKYAVIITDGYISYSYKPLKEATDTIPKDVTVLVVGLGYTDVNNLLTLARNKPQNVYNYNATPPLNDTYLIVGDLMRKIGC